MVKRHLTIEQKRFDIDLSIIALITFGVFLCYALTQNLLMAYVKDPNNSVISRLLLNAVIQFGIAGLGITIVCLLRKEIFHFMD